MSRKVSSWARHEKRCYIRVVKWGVNRKSRSLGDYMGEAENQAQMGKGIMME